MQNLHIYIYSLDCIQAPLPRLGLYAHNNGIARYVIRTVAIQDMGIHHKSLYTKHLHALFDKLAEYKILVLIM